MNDVFSINMSAVRRVAYTMLAALLVVAGLPFFQQGAAADQMAHRSIQMSDSAPSGGAITSGVGSGEDVTYRVSFDAVHEAGSLVIDFCSGNDTPILGDACTAPAGMDASSATLSPVSGKVGTGGDWTITATTSQIKLQTDTAANNIDANSSEIFDLEGITNPSATGTFFARIYTFPDDDYGGYVSATNPNLHADSDFGGIALSTVAVISITARVQESLTFCITSASPINPAAGWDDTAGAGTGANAGSCSATEVAANPPSVTIGHTIGGTTLVLDAGQVDLTDGTGADVNKPLYSQLSTNATNGAVINLRSNWACGGLSADGGSTCAIPAAGDTPTIFTAGTAAFGLFVGDSFLNNDASSSAATGTITPSAIYNNGVNVDDDNPADLALGMDDTTATAAVGGSQRSYSGSVSGTFGSTVASTTAPVYRVHNKFVFGATAALTTPAGIYTANMTMTATGTF